jgi:hypothetical protein
MHSLKTNIKHTQLETSHNSLLSSRKKPHEPILLRSKSGLITLLVRLTSLCGPSSVLDPMYAPILGIIFDRKRPLSISGRWFGIIKHAIPKQAFILWLAVNNRLTTGDRLLTCWHGVIREIQIVSYAEMELKAVTTCSFRVGLVLEFGKPVYSVVIS